MIHLQHNDTRGLIGGNMVYLEVHPDYTGDIVFTALPEPWNTSAAGLLPVSVAPADIPEIIAPLVISGNTGLGESPTFTEGFVVDLAGNDPVRTFTLQTDASGSYANVSGYVAVNKATLDAYTITANEQGTNLRVLSYLDAVLEETSAAFAVPSGLIAIAPVYTDGYGHTSTNSDVLSASIDAGSNADGTRLIADVTYGSTGGAAAPDTLSIGGNAMTQIGATNPFSTQAQVMFYQLANAPEGSQTLAATTGGAGAALRLRSTAFRPVRSPRLRKLHQAQTRTTSICPIPF
jgi:hypothetical protein